MTAFITQLRWCALPFVFIGAACLGIWLWLKFGDMALAPCPPDLVWYGAASGDKKCSWPLSVYLFKDMGDASVRVPWPCCCVRQRPRLASLPWHASRLF